MQLFMPFTIPMTMSLPQFHAEEATFRTRLAALLSPLWMVEPMPLIVLAIELRTLVHMVLTECRYSA